MKKFGYVQMAFVQKTKNGPPPKENNPKTAAIKEILHLTEICTC